MALESTTYINGLVTSNPAATDGLAAADDHLRLIKSTVKASFPGVTGAVTSTHAELNVLDGIDAGLTAAELSILNGVTSTATELNVLDGVPSTLTAAELGYVDGVTSAIQTQMDTKALAARTVTAGNALTGGGALTGDITIDHEDTSTQASVDNSGSTFIQDVTLDTYGHVTGLTSVAVPADVGIGVGQSWAQFTSSSRVIGTTYRNTTGRPIMVSVATNFPSEQYLQVSSNNSTFINVGTLGGHGNVEDSGSAQCIVPDDHYYKATGGTFIMWAELL